MTRCVVIAAVFFALASPALAAEFYIVKKTESGKCAVRDQKPDGTDEVLVGSATYASKEEAKAAKKNFAECGKKGDAN